MIEDCQHLRYFYELSPSGVLKNVVPSCMRNAWKFIRGGEVLPPAVDPTTFCQKCEHYKLPNAVLLYHKRTTRGQEEEDNLQQMWEELRGQHG